MRQSAFELMVRNLKLFDSMFGSQSTLAPPLPTAVDFVASLPEAASVFATTNRRYARWYASRAVRGDLYKVLLSGDVERSEEDTRNSTVPALR